MASLITGTKLIKKYGDEPHRAEVRHSSEWNEYQVHHYENGKHMGEGPVSYHDSDKEDAHNTAKITYEQRAKKREKLNNPSRSIVTSENREEFINNSINRKK